MVLVEKLDETPFREVGASEKGPPKNILTHAPQLEQSPIPVPAEAEEKALSQHRYLQSLIKRMAEDRGYRAIIEKPIPDGEGRVDVSVERDDDMIASEISIPTTDEQELHNIQKCLAAGYGKIVVCSPEKKTVGKSVRPSFQKTVGGRTRQSIILRA